jgi:hypothetical protein
MVGTPMSGDLIAAYAGGSAAQAALVAGTLRRSVPRVLGLLRHPAFAFVPLVSLVGVAFGLRTWPAAAGALATSALVLVPLLALAASARIGPLAVVLTVGMLIATLRDGHSLLGQVGALELVAASCMLLGALLVELTPSRWLGLGIVAMALADLVLVPSGLLEPANAALNGAGAVEGLPQLQRVELGPLTMGYGDLFLPAVVGALLSSRARSRRWVAALTFGFALAAGLLFLVADELPATVPVALALVVVEGAGVMRALLRRRRSVAGAPTAGPAAAVEIVGDTEGQQSAPLRASSHMLRHVSAQGALSSVRCTCSMRGASSMSPSTPRVRTCSTSSSEAAPTDASKTHDGSSGSSAPAARAAACASANSCAKRPLIVARRASASSPTLRTSITNERAKAGSAARISRKARVPARTRSCQARAPPTASTAVRTWSSSSSVLVSQAARKQARLSAKCS